MKDGFKYAGHSNTSARTSFLKLNQFLRNANHGQKTLSYIALNIRNSLEVS